MIRYEIHCLICNKHVAGLKEVEQELPRDEFRKVIGGVNMTYSCPYCYWKPYYAQMLIKLGIRKVKQFSLSKRLRWLFD